MVALNTSSWTMINYWSTSTGYDDYLAQVSVWGKVGSQSVENNTSIVDFWYCKRIYSPTNSSWTVSYHNDTSYTHRITCSGHSASASFAFGTVTTASNKSWTDISIPDPSDLYWSSVAHNADGTCSIEYTATGYRPGGTTYSEGGTIELPTIPRASKPTVNKNTVTLTGSDSVVITTNRKSSSFTHTLNIAVGGHTVSVTNVGASYTWTPAVADWMPYMRSWQETVTVTCTTYSGGNQIGSAQTCTFTLQVDTSTYKPVITGTSRTDTNSTTAALETTGTFIKGKSILQFTAVLGVNDTTYGATLKSAVITNGAQSQSYNLSGTSQTITFTGSAGISSGAITVKVTDNLGYSITQTYTVTLVNYTPVQILTVTTERTNSSGVHSETGTYIKYKITLTAFRGSFGQANNTITVYSSSKAASASVYDAEVTEQTYTQSGTGAVSTFDIEEVTLSGSYQASSQYDIKFRITDALSEAVSEVYRIHEGIPVVAWGADHFSVYGDLTVHNREDVFEYVTIGSSANIIAQSFTSGSVTCGANTAGSTTVSVTVPNGYHFVGIMQVWSNGNVVPAYSNSTGITSGHVTVWWCNPTSSSMSATFSVNVLFSRL